MKKARGRILAPEPVAGLVRSMHPQLKKKVRAAFVLLIADPYAGKPLKEELAGLRSFRVGRHRIIYRLRQENLIEVVAVGPRESIYEETYRLIRKQER